jgi:phage terminase small subunit
MGQRGPKPLPGNVHQLRGNASKKPIATLLDELKPEVEIPGCPRHLLPEARKEWKRVAAELERYGLVSKLDRADLALYCQAWAWWVYHEEQLQRAMALAAENKAAWEKAELDRLAGAEQRGESYALRPWVGGDGFMIPTPNGSFTYSPHWVAKNKAAEQVDKFAASFGLSPSSRSRVSMSDQYPFLPGMEPGGAGEQTTGGAAKPPLASLAR